MATKQTNIVANPSRGLVFFEGESICYNYKTQQWSRIPAYLPYGMMSVNSNIYDIGLIVYSAGSVDLQEQTESHVELTATVSTGAYDPGGRVLVKGIRPRVNGGSPTAQAGTQNALSDSVDWSTAASPNSRTNMASMRKEGRYARVSVSVAGGFNHIQGADVELSRSGND